MDLLKIANACLMHFNLFDLPDCQETLLAVHDHASSDAFRRDIETLLKRALDKLDPDGRIIWTGYVTMFNLDDDGFCDTQTWSLWKKLNTHPFGFAPPPAPLSIHLRGQLNHLVTLCNSVINDVIKKHGDGRTVFLTYEEDFRGGRFCEKDPRPEGLYFFSPCVNHKDSDKFPLHYNDIVESVSGTSAHDLYHGVELMRSAHPQLLTDSIDTCPCGGSGQACKDVEDSADMALPVAAAAAAAVATSTPGAQTNSSSNMLKRSQLITSHHTAIAKLVDIFTCALHLTSSGNSIIARHVYQEAFIWIAAKKLAERAPTFQNSVICTSDLATWHGELVDIELFRNVASEFCSQPAMDAVGRQDWDRKQLQQLTVRKNVVQDGQETEWDVVADVSLVTTIGPKSKILAIEKERERLGLSSKKGQRIIPWNITTSHCEDMMNGILRTCKFLACSSWFVLMFQVILIASYIFRRATGSLPVDP